ncbi:MAG: TIR domain-containing protein, partial [Anaerolineales bacterium]
MPTNRTYLLILGMLVLITTIVGIVGDIAVNQIPDSLKPYLWLAWPMLVVLILIIYALTVVQTRLENKLIRANEIITTGNNLSGKSHFRSNLSNSNFVYDVFISNSPANNSWVEQELIPRLKAIDVRIYDPREFVGRNKVAVIQESAEKCRRVLLVLSPSYFEDQWAQFGDQLFQFMDPGSVKRRIIPIIIENCELPLRLAQIIAVAFTEPEEGKENWERLLETVQLRLDDEESTDSISLSASAQQSEIRMSDPPTKDEVDQVINRLQTLIEDENNYPKAVEVAERYKAAVQEYENQPMLGLMNTWYGHALMYTGQTKEAISLFQDEIIGRLKALELSSADRDFEYWCEAMGRSYNHLGYINWVDLGHLEIAVKEIFNAIRYFLMSEEVFKDQLATAYDNL